ncbi:MAG TPA: PEP-CTERM sorting domain-containing protein [Tepidisphaeraceae bacterium]|nr:PEP-CTERM sorting domain-containing protein [Tepidisphaeraceae bacterium]
MPVVSKSVSVASLNRAALVAVALIASPLSAATTITGLTVTNLSGTSSSQNGVDGNGAPITGGISGENEYDLNYTGDIRRVDSIIAGGLSYQPGMSATHVYRRTATPDTDIVFFRGNGNASSPSLDLYGEEAQSLADMFSGNNLNVGVDNMFANRADANSNFSNIERVDFVFANGISVNTGRGFAVIERGNKGDHDEFGIVAITGIDQDGNPTSFGSILNFGLGNWGNTDLSEKQDYIVLRRDNYEGSDAEFAPSAVVRNSLGGVFVSLTDLAQLGSTIYGFALVGGDVTGSGTELVDWTNPNVFPTDTLQDNTNYDSNGVKINRSPGGLDPTGTLAFLYESPTAVPEPAAMGIIALAAGVLGFGRRRSAK